MSGELPVKSQCLPFSQIPHTTRLFLDFLSYSPEVRPFYPHSPRFTDWVKERKGETGYLRYDQARRTRVADILQRQNTNWGASARTLENVARLRGGASAVVTGQQVVLFGGPLFSIFKALTAVKLSNEATSAGVDAVPIFWLASTDHDLAEANQVVMPGPDGSLQKLTVSTHAVEDAPVGTVKFGPEIDAVVEAAAGILGDSPVTGFLREAYRPGENFGSAFARLFARLFAEWGVILLDASDPELNQIAEPIYRSAIERAAELDDALLARGKELEAGGYHQQVKVTPSSTLLFALREGSRVPVHRRASTNSDPAEFAVAQEKISQKELLQRIGSTPQNFSANVLLRPVVQDYLLPTLAYTGGAAEVAYFAQAAVVYQALLGCVTPVVPRFSASIIEPKSQALLDRYGLALPDTFHSPEELRETLAERTLPQELQAAFDQADTALKKALSSLSSALARLDKTLVEAAGNAGSKMHHQLDQLRSRAGRAELRQNEILARHAQQLSNALYPNKTLSEREIAGIYFIARQGGELLRDLYDTIHTDCLDHQMISL
jgi:bacillithiol synthase